MMKDLGNCLAQVITPVVLIFFHVYLYPRGKLWCCACRHTVKHFAPACSLSCPFQGPIPTAGGNSCGVMGADRGNLQSSPAAAILRGAAAEEEMCWVIGRILGWPEHKAGGRK